MLIVFYLINEWDEAEWNHFTVLVPVGAVFHRAPLFLAEGAINEEQEEESEIKNAIRIEIYHSPSRTH